jgi:hypothetical protein
MTTESVHQTVEGTGDAGTHTHPDQLHDHDHYHVTHHHRSGISEALGEFEHRASWHTHEHSHAALTHSHDFREADEIEHHGKDV